MNTTQLYKHLQQLVFPVDKENFIYDLLLAYEIPKAQITQLKNGRANKSNIDGQLVLARKILFQPTDSGSLFSTMEILRKNPASMRHNPRFFVVTDFKALLAYDTKIDDTLDIELSDLAQNMQFFMPWAGRERFSETQENPADIKAAERMARLYDEILKTNPNYEKDSKERHKLNVFLSRLLFCFFAEDTNIFPDRIFSRAITELTEEDGSDLNTFLNELFKILNTADRNGCIDQLCKFPYVNGGLFGDSYDAPQMTRRARRMILDCGALDWSEINPDIFGSMIQAVVDPEQRGGLGMHYTSVPNIMKVIGPLFLNDLREEFEKVQDDAKKLGKLLNRISRIRFFDPACGSGNFLIITYKEIRKLEMEILEQRQSLDGYIPLHSMITLDHFYGIELDDFAHEVAILSLWLAEHQMNVQFKMKFGEARPALPLRESGHIACKNATRTNWSDICPASKDSEIYIMGNPPYLGTTFQSEEQKKDISTAFNNHKNIKKIDYISCWIIKGAQYIKDINAKLAFVSTNSICQGEQVATLWPTILNLGIEIFFAHQSFKWSNSAKQNAGVTCCVVGLRNINKQKKLIFTNDSFKPAFNITPYLTEGDNIFIKRSSSPISQLPQMEDGNKPVDGGNLILCKNEMQNLINTNPNASYLLRRFFGSQEFIKGIDRWCLWITNENLDSALLIPDIKDRVEKTKKMRLASTDSGARNLASRPHQFREMKSPQQRTLIVPSVSSELREYIPIGFLDKNSVVSNLAFAIYDPETYIFGIISSKMHQIWVHAVAGRLETRIRYSNVLCYNTFPFPNISEEKKEEIELISLKILDIRDENIGLTPAQLYDSEKMPKALREAHHKLDIAVDKCYRNKPFENDSERLEHLFKMYEAMTK